MSTLDFTKGYDFETEVEEVLRKLVTQFPKHVQITRQPDFNNTLRPHRPDFELRYEIGALIHHHLIECQNRQKSSQEIADKIYAIRGLSDRNRFIFIYKDNDFLTFTLKKRLDEMGVLHYDFQEFKAFILELTRQLNLVVNAVMFNDQNKNKQANSSYSDIKYKPQSDKGIMNITPPKKLF